MGMVAAQGNDVLLGRGYRGRLRSMVSTTTERPLTGKQAAFVTAYLANNYNALQAARSAGYAAPSDTALAIAGHRALKNLNVRAEINRQQAALQDRTEVTPDLLMGKLMAIYERAMQETPVLSVKGTPTGEYRFDGNVANRSIELMGKHIGMFVDRSETKTYGQFRIEVVKLDDPRETAPEAIVEGNAKPLTPGDDATESP